MTTLDIIRRIRLASRAVSVGFEQQTGSTIRHLLVLHALHTEGDMMQGKASELTGIDRSTMTHVVNKLEAAGLVSSSVFPGDSRAKLLHLTAKGKDHLTRLSNAAESLFGDRFGLSDQRATGLLNTLTKVAGYVEGGGVHDAAQ